MAPQGAAGTKRRAEHIMSEYLDYRGYGATETRDRTHTLFGQTMGYVAVTARLLRARCLPWAQPGPRLGDRGLHRRLRVPDQHELHRAAVGDGDRGPALRGRRAARRGGLADDRLLRDHEPAGRVAGRRRSGAVRGGLRGGGLRDPAGPVGDRPGVL